MTDKQERYFVVSEGELEALRDAMYQYESIEAEAACRAREVVVVAVDPTTETSIGWEIKK